MRVLRFHPAVFLNDKNDINFSMRINGIKPFATNAGFDSLITMMVLNNELIEVKDSYTLSSQIAETFILVPVPSC